ncbi:hypothetical protein QC764_0039810 [Podospora pseudoanserina]|uniref:Uncharacterized protein n=1 Tax=Podospora pseudoanserina TaxID=2609844 RepID=A0ABR0IIE5_9PEZI|nr:hypothetical protein QC764_0039810 [Podospora pseudoanserina]
MPGNLTPLPPSPYRYHPPPSPPVQRANAPFPQVPPKYLRTDQGPREDRSEERTRFWSGCNGRELGAATSYNSTSRGLCLLQESRETFLVSLGGYFITGHQKRLK